MKEKFENNENFFARMTNLNDIKEKQLEIRRAQKEEEEIKQCTFKPEIHEYKMKPSFDPIYDGFGLRNIGSNNRLNQNESESNLE